MLAAKYPHAYIWLRDFLGEPSGRGRNAKRRESDQFTSLVNASGLNGKNPVSLSMDDFGSITVGDE